MLGTNDAWHRGGEPERVRAGLKELATTFRRGAALVPRLVFVLPPGAKAGRLEANLREVVHPDIRSLVEERPG